MIGYLHQCPLYSCPFSHRQMQMVARYSHCLSNERLTMVVPWRQWQVSIEVKKIIQKPWKRKQGSQYTSWSLVDAGIESISTVVYKNNQLRLEVLQVCYNNACFVEVSSSISLTSLSPVSRRTTHSRHLQCEVQYSKMVISVFEALVRPHSL